MKLIIASDDDSAAKNISGHLFNLFNFEKSEDSKLYTCGEVGFTKMSESVLQLRDIPFPAEELIVASKHTSESGNPSLTAHVPGDPDRKEIGVAAPATLAAAIRELFVARDEFGLDYDVSFEATHHGPTGLDVPVTFVEIGSTAREWRDPKAGEAVARAIMKAAQEPLNGVNAVGFGGTHYARRHTDVVLRTGVRIGHIFPKYIQLNEELAKLAVKRTKSGAGVFALDWKGLNGSQRALIGEIGQILGVKVVRERDILAGKGF